HSRSLHNVDDVCVRRDQHAGPWIDVEHSQESLLSWQRQHAERLRLRIESINYVAVRRRDPNHSPNRIPRRRIRRAGGVREIVKPDQLAPLRVELGELAAAIEREIDDVFVADRDAARTGISVWQLDRPDVSLLLDIEAADRAVAELAVPDFAEVSGHDQAVQRGAAGASRRWRRRPELGCAALGIEVTDGVVADVREPDSSFTIG